MGLSSRLLLVPADGALRRMAEADLDRLFRGSGKWRVPALSGERVRWTSLVVELFNRQPVRVVRRSFAFLQFDDTGRLDVDRMNREQVARIDVPLASVLTREVDAGVIDASSHFTARGGSWKPDDELIARLDAAALGRVLCPRLRVES